MHRKTLITGVLLLGAAGCEGTKQDLAHGPIPAAAEVCSAADWDEAAYDRIYAIDGGRLPLVFVPDLEDRPAAELRELAAALEAARSVAPERFAPAARVVLQNDLWGVAQRLEPDGANDPDVVRVRSAAIGLVRRLALSKEELEELDAARGPWTITDALPSSEGWHEVGTEHAVFGHERLYGLRRLFRVFRQGDDGFALASQLVALGRDGSTVLTKITGEIEMLRVGSEGATAARVWELDRHGVRCDGPAGGLREVDAVAHVPGRGANAFFAEFDPPSPLRDLPCRRCHDVDGQMSLPDPLEDIEKRHGELLELATTRARGIMRAG